MSNIGNGTEEMSVEQAADQIVSYLYPNNEWIGYHWIDTVVLMRMAGNLKRALERARAERRQTFSHRKVEL